MKQETSCPYCSKTTEFTMPLDYAPTYVFCTSCNQKFIIERLEKGFQTLTLEEAPCCSDPECREEEMSQGQEE